MFQCAGVQRFIAVPGKVKSGGKATPHFTTRKEALMNNIIYLVGLVVVVIAVLSFLGLR